MEIMHIFHIRNNHDEFDTHNIHAAVRSFELIVLIKSTLYKVHIINIAATKNFL